tara:strand:- start:413 stop:817 length:405 start_codon:yes stop_codon:yes gene_type:complete
MTFDKLNIKYDVGPSNQNSGSQFSAFNLANEVGVGPSTQNNGSQFEDEDSELLGISVSPNRQLLALRLTKGLALWDLQTKREIAKIDGHGAGPFSFTADSNRIAFVASDSSVYFYDIGNSKLIMTSQPTKQLQM